MILLFQIILFVFGTPTQPVNWPTDIFKQKYFSYHGLATGTALFLLRHHVTEDKAQLLDENAKTLRYFKESYESSHHRAGVYGQLGRLKNFWPST